MHARVDRLLVDEPVRFLLREPLAVLRVVRDGPEGRNAGDESGETLELTRNEMVSRTFPRCRRVDCGDTHDEDPPPACVAADARHEPDAVGEKAAIEARR